MKRNFVCCCECGHWTEKGKLVAFPLSVNYPNILRLACANGKESSQNTARSLISKRLVKAFVLLATIEDREIAPPTECHW